MYSRFDGPPTVAAIFAYGGIHGMTMMNIVRDAAISASRCSILQYRHEEEELGAELKISPLYPMLSDEKGWRLQIVQPAQDALIDRARAMTAQNFLEKMPEFEVLIMLDHDITWAGPRTDYEGDLCHLARKCAETRGIVGALVSKKVRDQGVATFWKREGEHQLGQDGITDVWYVGAAFTAYHRDALQRVSDATEIAAPGFRPIFMPIVVPFPTQPRSVLPPQLNLHLSEDWAFCHRARELGIESYVAFKPLITHHGNYGYTVAADSGMTAKPEIIRPKFSLLHASRGRPEIAKKAKKEWLDKASKKHSVEYILSLDEDDPLLENYPAGQNGICVVSGKSRGNVDAYNRAAYLSHGEILIQVHDDLIPPQNWDELIVRKIPMTQLPVVLRVDDGVAREVRGGRTPLTILIGTREWFKQCGYFWSPDFVSVFCDDHMDALSAKMGVQIDAMDIKFKHMWEGADRDATQRRSYSSQNWALGERMLNLHKLSGFPLNPELWPKENA
jgi:hypothetical protein